ncbi:MAG: alpha/beta fold hydrolase [Caldilineaceae bacterium]
MQLEILTCLPPTEPVRQPALLCIPGAWHNAACWLPFLNYFAQRGRRAAALNLRGHGNSPGRNIHQFGLGDYGEDIATAVAQLIKEWGQAPILIGHSSGGWLVQKYLEQHSAPAGVLLASLPPTGVRQVRNPFAQRHRGRFFLGLTGLSVRALIGDAAIVRKAFYAPTTPLAYVHQQMVHLQTESSRMLFGLGGRTQIEPGRIQAPLLVLGAGADNFLPATAVTATAQAYATQATFIPNLGHAMMTDIGWERVADAILAWLANRL